MSHHFLIAAPSSHSGKTTVTLGLLRALANRGLRVQPFKCGPDFIDTKFLSMAAHRAAINLDTFMMGQVHVQTLYQRYGTTADISITEGVMGLFDGAERMKGSSAEIAMLLGVPVVLVVNAKAMAYSVAPLLYGFKNFHPGVNVAGVIFNQVNTESHYSFLRDAAADAGVVSLGYVPTNEAIHIPSRHLGLSTARVDTDHIGRIAGHLEKTVDLDALLTLSRRDVAVGHNPVPLLEKKKALTMAVARDEAFQFLYHENLSALGERGDITFFSPLHDSRLPAADVLYLPGGYPELYAEALSANTAMRQAVFDFCNKGGKVLAECGGMMYLGIAIVNGDGHSFPMVNFLDLETSTAKAKLTLGYRRVRYDGHTFAGHEFHYSVVNETGPLLTIGEAVSAREQVVDMKVYRKKNVVASYMHFYWGHDPLFFDTLFSRPGNGHTQ